MPVVFSFLFTTFFRGNYNFHTSLYSFFNHSVCGESSICQKSFRSKSVNYSASFFAISSGTFCNNSSDWHTMRIHGQMYLCVEPPFVRLMS